MLAYFLGLFLLISSFEAKTTEDCGFLYDGTMYTSMLFTEPNMKVINNCQVWGPGLTLSRSTVKYN